MIEQATKTKPLTINYYHVWTNNKIYIQDKLNLWIKENAEDPKYVNNSGLLQDDFEKEYIRIIYTLRKYGRASDTLFGKFKGTGFDGTGTVVENIDAEIQQKKTEKEEKDLPPEKIAEMTLDLKAINSVEFRRKYGMTKEQFR